MYTQTTKLFGNYKVIQVTNTVSGEYFSVIPELGGRVHEICLRGSDVLVDLLDNENNPNALQEERWYRGCILLPFPNRIRDGVYDFNNRHLELAINMPSEGHAIHGVMYNKSFFVVEKSSEEMNTLTLEYIYDGNNEGYPFPCTVIYVFTLNQQEFFCTITVTNKGDTSLPLGVGWHPYFTLGCDVDEILLRLPEVTTLEVDERMIPTGRKDVMDDYRELSQIHDTQLDTGFEIYHKGGVATTIIHNPKTNVTMESWQSTGDKGFNYVQIFTPPGRASIAIEPMTCPANAFNSKESLIELAPKERWSGSFGVKLN